MLVSNIFMKVSDFKISQNLGEGGFSKIFLVSPKDDSNKKYALKAIQKRQIQRANRNEVPEVEKRCYDLLKDVPHIAQLNSYFEDNMCNYFLLDYYPNLDLVKFFKKHQFSNEIEKTNCIRNVFLQVLEALSEIHKRQIIHRDIKLENILIDNDGKNAYLCDFGSAFIGEIESDGFCECNKIISGTLDYNPPEVLSKDKRISPGMDLWCYGVSLYTIFVGQPPFYSPNRIQTLDNIKDCKYDPTKVPNEEAQDLIIKLLKIDPKERLGFNDYKNGYETIKSHPFFKIK